MKRKDYLLIGCLLLVVVVVFAVSYYVRKPSKSVLRITVAGEVYGEYDLSNDQEIQIGDTNICVIEDKRVSMIYAKCPDHLCMKQKALDGTGGSIVCLPNKVVLEITTEEPVIDSIAG